MIRNTVYAIPVIGILFCACFFHGLLTDRWGAAQEVEEAQARLDRLPLSIGDWTGRPLEFQPNDARQLYSWVCREYTHNRHPYRLTVFITFGKLGKVAVHTPDYCYAGSGYEVVSGPALRSLGATAAGKKVYFSTGEFEKAKGSGRERIAIWWALTGDGNWDLPENPRLALARFPNVYKMYVIADALPAKGRPAEDAIHPFIVALAEAFNQTFFG